MHGATMKFIEDNYFVQLTAT